MSIGIIEAIIIMHEHYPLSLPLLETDVPFIDIDCIDY